MKRRIKSSIVIALTLVSAFLGFYRTTLAESPKGITVSPAVLYFTVSSNKPSHSQTVKITNNENTTVQLTAQIKNVDDSSGILAPTSVLSTEQSKAVQISTSAITLPPGGSTDITITVSTNDSLKPGGSYFSLVITQSSEVSNAVGLHPSVGAALFVTNEDGANRHIALQATSAGKILFGIPNTIQTRFMNDGNVVVVPRGVIVVGSNNVDAYVAKGVINTESQPLFPGKTIVLDVPMKKIAKVLIPTKVHIIYQYRFDGTDQIITTAHQAVIIPPLFIVFLLMIAIITTVLLRYSWKHRRRKNRTDKKPKEGAAQPREQKQATPIKKIAVKDATDGDKITVRTD